MATTFNQLYAQFVFALLILANLLAIPVDAKKSGSKSGGGGDEGAGFAIKPDAYLALMPIFVVLAWGAVQRRA